MHKSRMKSTSAMYTDRRLPHSLFDMDVGDRPRRISERARDLDRRAREVARQSILVEENSAMVLGDHVDVIRRRSHATGR